MRRLLLVIVLVVTLCLAHSVAAIEPDQAVMQAPQIEADSAEPALLQLASSSVDHAQVDDSASALEAEFEAQAAAEVDAETRERSHIEAGAEHEVDAEAEAEQESESESEQEKKSAPAPSSIPHRLPEVKPHIPHSAAQDYPTNKLIIERSTVGGPPDSVELPDGRVLVKSFVVDPNLRPEVPKIKRAPKHPQERTLSRKEGDRLGRQAKVKAGKASAVRKEWRRLNPALARSASSRSRAYSPTASFARSLRDGKFRSMKFDQPAVSVVQHLTVRTHAPSVRQRAEVRALRSASRTLHRIRAKSREFRVALRALRKAKASIQRGLHRHHVLRAIQATKVAARASRRAAWSGLMQHENLRKDLMRTIARALRKGRLTGAARKEAIKAILKQKLTPQERAKLHAFIKGNLQQGRQQRHAARRRIRQPSRRRRVSRQSPKPAVSAKDQRAINALIARIRAARAQPSAPVKRTPIRARKVAAASKSSNPLPAPRSLVSVEAELHSAEAMAAEAEADAIAQLGMDTEIDDAHSDELLMKTEAQVNAAQEGTEEFLNEHGVEME